MPSEAPFEKLAGPLETDPPDRAVSVRPGPIETPFSLAHRGTGEWRNWRDVLELNELYSPFDLSERAQAGAIEALADPDDIDDLDVLSELGLEHSWVYVSSEAPEAFFVQMTEADDYFKIIAGLPGGSTGDAFFLLTEEVNGQEFVEFSAYVGDETVEIRMSSAAWLIFWLHRKLHFQGNLPPTRNLAILPPA